MLNCLGEILPRAAALWGDRRALFIDGESFTYAQLDSLSNRLARGFLERGLEPGERVTLYAGNSWEWIVTYYGVLKAGGVINPINAMLTPSEVAFVIEDCGAKTVVSTSAQAPKLLEELAGKEVAVIAFGEDLPTGAIELSSVLADNAAGFEPVPRGLTDLSTIGYTSGTTGHPKGAMLSHQSVLLNSEMTALMHVRTEEDSVVTALPCAHVYGNVVMNGAFLHGMTLILHPRFDPGEIMASIQEHRATMFEGVPTMYLYMLAHPELDAYDLSSLTKCTVGGQTMATAKMKQVEERFGCPLIELWGMTEIGGLGTTHPLYGHNVHGSIGVALPYCEIRIADFEDASTTMNVGEPGELMIRGPITMMGYYGNDEATAATIEPDGWLHTGDVATMDEMGNAFVVDRKKDMILTAGFNVYPAEIERVLVTHPSVAMVAVAARADDVKGELAVAHVVLAPGKEATKEELIAHSREHLAAYKVPRDVVFLDELPTTSTGKILRRALREDAS